MWIFESTKFWRVSPAIFIDGGSWGVFTPLYFDSQRIVICFTRNGLSSPVLTKLLEPDFDHVNLLTKVFYCPYMMMLIDHQRSICWKMPNILPDGTPQAIVENKFSHFDDSREAKFVVKSSIPRGEGTNIRTRLVKYDVFYCFVSRRVNRTGIHKTPWMKRWQVLSHSHISIYRQSVLML